jgi:hypothetical protein
MSRLFERATAHLLAIAPEEAKPHSGHDLLLYATSMLRVYQHLMIASFARLRASCRAALAGAMLLTLGTALSGCADMSDGMTSAFADPAKYELYNCQQLEKERKYQATKLAELQGLMNKAQSGVAGPVVAELAYRNDYIALRGQARNADAAWVANKCRETPAKAAATPEPAPVAAPAATSSHGQMKSGSAVY